MGIASSVGTLAYFLIGMQWLAGPTEGATGSGGRDRDRSHRSHLPAIRAGRT